MKNRTDPENYSFFGNEKQIVQNKIVHVNNKPSELIWVSQVPSQSDYVSLFLWCFLVVVALRKRCSVAESCTALPSLPLHLLILVSSSSRDRVALASSRLCKEESMALDTDTFFQCVGF